MNVTHYLFLVTAILAGCAVETSHDDDTEANLTGSSSICSTLDYTHPTPSSAYYREFATDAEAATFVQKLVASGMFGSGTLKEITHEPHLTKLVADVYDGFQKAFPKETAGMTRPPLVALLDSPRLNASAVRPTVIDEGQPPKAPWLFVVHTGILASGASDSALRGVFAHELGHLILRSVLPEMKERLRTSYMLEGSEDGVLGAAQKDDPKVAAHVESILKIQERIGGSPELGFPDPLQGSNYAQVVLQVKNRSGEHCTAAKTQLTALQDVQRALIPSYAATNFTPRVPTAEEKSKLDALLEAVSNEARACLAGEAGSLADLTAAANHLPPEAVAPSHADHAKLVSLMLPAEVRVDSEMPNASIVDRLLRAEEILRQELLTLRGDPAFPIDRIRVFDSEEDADDAAVRVLAAIGDDPLGLGQFMLSAIPAGSRNACLQAVKDKKPIPFGRFIDVHPAACWRYYHATQFAGALAKCTAK